MLIVILVSLYFTCCKKDDENKSVNYLLLTSHPWQSDNLLADGVEAGGPGELLHGFSGETRFYDDGTGYIGDYNGTWSFHSNETQLLIDSDSLPVVITVFIEELTEESLKITTQFPDRSNLLEKIDIRMTFVPFIDSI